MTREFPSKSWRSCALSQLPPLTTPSTRYTNGTRSAVPLTPSLLLMQLCIYRALEAWLCRIRVQNHRSTSALRSVDSIQELDAVCSTTPSGSVRGQRWIRATPTLYSIARTAFFFSTTFQVYLLCDTTCADAIPDANAELVKVEPPTTIMKGVMERDISRLLHRRKFLHLSSPCTYSLERLLSSLQRIQCGNQRPWHLSTLHTSRTILEVAGNDEFEHLGTNSITPASREFTSQHYRRRRYKNVLKNTVIARTNNIWIQVDCEPNRLVRANDIRTKPVRTSVHCSLLIRLDINSTDGRV